MILASASTMFGQVRSEYFRSLFIDVDVNAGLMSQHIKANPFSTNYTEAINNSYQGKLKFTQGLSVGYEGHLGYYFDQKRRFGVEAGVNVYSQFGKLGMDSFHVEFKKATEDQDGYFRQIISTDHAISETIRMNSTSIPLLLTYKKTYNDNLFFTVSAGILYNIKAASTYKTNANFDYEALYQFEGNVPVYDNSLIPDSTDFLVTKKGYNAFLAKNPNNPTLNEFFKFQDSLGVAKGSVGLNESPNKTTGLVKYSTGSLGYTAEIAANYRLMKNISIRGGIYYTAQSFKNPTNNSSATLTDAKVQGKPGQDLGVTYNSLLSEVNSLNGSNYGITLGIRVYINRTAWKYMEPDMNRITPEGPHPKD
jgi:hypothetical protein